MAEIIFNCEQTITTIKCDINDKMSNIIKKYLTIIKTGEENFQFLYGGNRIDKELSFMEQANNYDKNRKVMNIMVIDYNSIINENDQKLTILEVIFHFEGKETIIKCDINNKMSNIIGKFLKIINKEDIFQYSYNDKLIDIEQTFNELANNDDKKNLKMNIIVKKDNTVINKIRQNIGMAGIVFNFEGTETIIQCDINDKIKDIIKKFLVLKIIIFNIYIMVN